MDPSVRPWRPLPAALILALAALLALVVDPAHPAHAFNGSTSACALQGTTGYTDEGQQTDYARFQNPVGTKHIGLIYVDFPDAGGTALPLTSYDDTLAGAKDWMWNASYGRTTLDIQAPYANWVHMPKNSTEYDWERGFSWTTHQVYVKDALTAAADAGVDLSRYDMFYVVPTATATAIGHSPTFIQDPAAPTWVWNPQTGGWVLIRWAVTFGQDMWHWGYKVADHETSHTFGLPDLYAFNGDLNQYVGGWDLMGRISGPAPLYFGWEAWKFGWITDGQVSCLTSAGTYATTLTGLEYGGGGYRLAVIRTSATTAYVAESRKAAYNDSDTCATGVLVYKVDTSVTTGNGPIQVVGNPDAAAPAGNCTALDMQTWQPGQWFQDDTARIRIYVNASDASSDTVWTYRW
ncbi:M6 family metalloprotease domain-containing protein [Kitasatospora sp. NPDC094028]